MGAFDIATKTIRADWWDEGESVTIKQFTFAERQTINASFNLEMKMQVPDGRRRGRRNRSRDEVQEMLTQMDMSHHNQLILQMGIVDWTFTNGNGQLLPVTDKNIRALRDDYANFILDEIDDFTTPRDEDEEEQFRNADSRGSEQGRGRRDAGGRRGQSDNEGDGLELAIVGGNADANRAESSSVT